MVKMEDCGGQMLVIAAPIQIWRFRFPEMVVPQNGWFTMDNPIQNGWFRGTTCLGNIHVSYIKYVIIQIIPKWRCTTLGSPHYLHMVNVPHVCRVIYCINLQADLCIRKCGSLWTSNQWNIRDLQYITHGTLTSSNHSNHGIKKNIQILTWSQTSAWLSPAQHNPKHQEDRPGAHPRVCAFDDPRRPQFPVQVRYGKSNVEPKRKAISNIQNSLNPNFLWWSEI